MPKKLDLNQLTRVAHELRRESGALIVLIIRVDDLAFSIHDDVSPNSVAETIEHELPAIVQHLAESRKKKHP